MPKIVPNKNALINKKNKYCKIINFNKFYYLKKACGF